nr:hypothetical protein BaRGS_015107 [Batillaria attramentaria]
MARSLKNYHQDGADQRLTDHEDGRKYNRRKFPDVHVNTDLHKAFDVSLASDVDLMLRDSPFEDFVHTDNMSTSSLSSTHSSMFNFTWPIRDSQAVIGGRITLGALHMVHERSETIVCGKIMPQGGIQALETMLYTLDYVNQEGVWAGRGQRVMPPGVNLGVLAKDDCDRDIFGLEQAVEFIKDDRARWVHLKRI